MPRSAAAAAAEKQLHIILDIDETLVHYIPQIYIEHTWSRLPASERRKYQTVTLRDGSLVIKRPHLDEFLNALFSDPARVKVYLWTMSSEPYAREIAERVIRNGSGNGSHKLSGIFSRLDCEASIAQFSHRKDLRYFYNHIPGTSAANTVIVDDLPINASNSILIAPFALWGRNPLRAAPYRDLSRDAALLSVERILRTIQ